MARGRFISNRIITDRAVNELSSDTCRLAFTWLLTLADKEGRVSGEPDLLLSMLFPRRRDIFPDEIEEFINEWVNAGFVTWYEASDKDRYLQFVNFEKHQVGLRKDRESDSQIPAPEECRIIAGRNRVNVKLIKVNDNNNVMGGFGELSDAYEKNIGGLSPMIVDMLKEDLEDYGKILCLEAIKIAVKNNKRKWSYVRGILVNMRADGITGISESGELQSDKIKYEEYQDANGEWKYRQIGENNES